MRGNEYQELAKRTMDRKLSKKALLEEGLMGLNGEAGEAIDILKKHKFHGHELDSEHLASELGDCLWYIAIAGFAIGWRMEDIMEENIKKLEKRYPNGFEESRSINREVGDI